MKTLYILTLLLLSNQTNSYALNIVNANKDSIANKIQTKDLQTKKYKNINYFNLLSIFSTASSGNGLILMLGKADEGFLDLLFLQIEDFVCITGFILAIISIFLFPNKQKKKNKKGLLIASIVTSLIALIIYSSRK